MRAPTVQWQKISAAPASANAKAKNNKYSPAQVKGEREMIKRFLLKPILMGRELGSQYFSLSWNVAAIAMSLEGPLHKVINCASIDKKRGERWIILFAKGIIEA